MIKAGFHLSISGGICNAPIEAAAAGYGAMQLFVSSTRSWQHTKISEEDASRFKELSKDLDIIVHVPYLCNPSSPNEDVWNKSQHMLQNNLLACEMLKIDSLVVHIGSHLGKGIGYGISRAVKMLGNSIDCARSVDILLENSAGYQNSVGSKFSEIGEIIESIGSNRVNMCLDTCHAFAAGYDISNKPGVDNMVQNINEHVGIRRMKFVHLNDSKYPINSGRDRHFHISKGYIGRAGFDNLFFNEAFRSGSYIMETPIDPLGNNDTNMSEFASIMRSAKLKYNNST